MEVITANHVNEALHRGLELIEKKGINIDSRNGNTREVPCPVATVYTNPLNRVLLSRVRDVNPFFHLFEALWVLAGRKDLGFLYEFNKQMALYSDDGKVFNAPYGWRIRQGVMFPQDQIKAVVKILKGDPNSRQAVIQMWSEFDLLNETKDKACNMLAVFRIRKNVLYMTICNRSNDIIWGAYGANVVQFSMLMEYVAAHINVKLGTYTHVSNSYHVYTTGKGGDKYNELMADFYNQYDAHYNPHLTSDGMNLDDIYRCTMNPNTMNLFDIDLYALFKAYDNPKKVSFENNKLNKLISCEFVIYKSDYFKQLIRPMLQTWITYKNEGRKESLEVCETISDDPWRIACKYWIENRIKRSIK